MTYLNTKNINESAPISKEEGFKKHKTNNKDDVYG